ncbi:hypothetical protein TSOC_001766 [Tetrabaena socialis]|uniref:Uncharacterized protein n=1 Tax=Tetrabaena socialis TaxID=47790 RepID=A0A2J8AFQ8_9CHLO|nr:hypothetical protein TSOC_001766 [Tetrabaena socialis]|eukprot:PNH11353.1 hypothetical protein TSOC_001766 [Tetrabaena socialis]
MPVFVSFRDRLRLVEGAAASSQGGDAAGGSARGVAGVEGRSNAVRPAPSRTPTKAPECSSSCATPNEPASAAVCSAVLLRLLLRELQGGMLRCLLGLLAATGVRGVHIGPASLCCCQAASKLRRCCSPDGCSENRLSVAGIEPTTSNIPAPISTEPSCSTTPAPSTASAGAAATPPPPPQALPYNALAYGSKQPEAYPTAPWKGDSGRTPAPPPTLHSSGERKYCCRSTIPPPLPPGCGDVGAAAGLGGTPSQRAAAPPARNQHGLPDGEELAVQVVGRERLGP